MRAAVTMHKVAWSWLLPVAVLLTLLAACGREGHDRHSQPDPRIEVKTLALRGGERPTSLPRKRDRIEIQAWSDAGLIASIHVRRTRSRKHAGFQAAPFEDDPTLWCVEDVPGGTTVLALQRWTRGTVVAVARPILLRPTADEATLVEWMPEEDLATVHCTARFAGLLVSRARYVVRWNGLPLPRIDSNGPLASLRVPGGEDVEVSCSKWRRAEDYGLPPPRTVNQPPGTTAELTFDLPSGHRIGIRAIDAGGDPVPSRVRTWRLEEGATPRPWSESWGELEESVGVQVLPGRYGVLVQTREAGSGWREFRVDAPPVDGDPIEVPVRAMGPRLRVAIEPAEDGPDDFGVARLERVKAPSPDTSFFWYEHIRSRSGRTFETGPLPPGEYDLALREVGAGGWWVRRVHVAGTEVQEFTTRGPSWPQARSPGSSAHSVAVDVSLPNGAWPTGTWVILSRLDAPGRWSRACPVSLGSALFTKLPVGRYRASIRESWTLPFAAESTSADVTIDGEGGQRRLQLSPAPR